MNSIEQRAECIRQTREFMRLSQGELSTLMGYSRGTLVRFESGEQEPPDGFWKRLDYVYRGYLRELDKQIKKTACNAA